MITPQLSNVSADPLQPFNNFGSLLRSKLANLGHIRSRPLELPRQGDANLASQKLKQNSYSAVVIETLKLTHEVGAKAEVEALGRTLN